jgi:hypothetical protein
MMLIRPQLSMQTQPVSLPGYDAALPTATNRRAAISMQPETPRAPSRHAPLTIDAKGRRLKNRK